MALNAATNLIQQKMGELSVDPANQDKQNVTNQEMLACCWFGRQKLEMKKVPKPDITNDEDVIVKITGSTVCGSDLHLYHGEILQLKSGDILGHECIGIVEKVGSKVTKVKPGDRVVAAFNIACGNCEYCSKKLYTCCESSNNSAIMEKLYGQRISGVMGYSHFLGGFAGVQAEYGRIIYGNTNLLKIPDDIPDEKALFLSDIVPTSYHAVWTADVRESDTVGVWGLGPIGLSVCQWLRNVFKAKRIIAIDNVPERLELAKKLWDVESVNYDVDKDIVSKLYELEPKGLDRSIDCAGFRYTKGILHMAERAIGLETDTGEVINEMIRSTKKFGTIALIADYAAFANHILVGGIMEKGLRFIGCGQAPIQRHWDTCLDHIKNNDFDPTKILTHRFPLDQTVEVYKAFDKKQSGIIKVFLETRFSYPTMPGTPSLMNVKDAI